MRFLAGLLAAVSVGAQALPIPHLRIELRGCQAEKVLFVLNGDEDHARPLTLKDGGWTGLWTEPQIYPGAYASLHLSGSRTWGRSVFVDENASPRVALFKFVCDDGETINERIAVDERWSFTYCRQLRRKDEKDPLDRAINEWSPSKHVIRDWRTRDEIVRLLLDSKSVDCDAPGLVLNNLRQIKDPQHAPPAVEPEDINDALCWQHLQQKTSAAHTSSNACEEKIVDPRARLIKLTLKRVE